MLYTLDASTALDLVVSLLTFFLVTLPGKFITVSLNSGAFHSIWVNLFTNKYVIQAAFILSLIGGVYFYFRDQFAMDIRGGRGSKGGNKF